MLSILNYRKVYHGVEILSIEKLLLKPGIYWIKGENGSGKSTLFRSIAGITPFQGDILFRDISVKRNPVEYRKLVHYSEAEPLYPGFLTAKDLIRFIGKTRNVSLDAQQQYAALFGIESFFEKPCQTYSSGMMKKLSLTLAMLGNTPVIILDEPLITLDTGSREILIREIERRAALGVTFLISSHQELEDPQRSLAGSFNIRHKKLISDGDSSGIE